MILELLMAVIGANTHPSGAGSAGRVDAVREVVVRRVASMHCKAEPCYLRSERRPPGDTLMRKLKGLDAVVPIPAEGVPAGARLNFVIDLGPVKFPSADHAEIGVAVTSGGGVLWESCTHFLELVAGEWRYGSVGPSCLVF